MGRGRFYADGAAIPETCRFSVAPARTVSHPPNEFNRPLGRAVYTGMTHDDPRDLAVTQAPSFAEKIFRSDLTAPPPASNTELLVRTDARIAEIVRNDPVVKTLELEREMFTAGLRPEDRANGFERKVAEIGAEFLKESFWKQTFNCTYAEATAPIRALALQILEVRIATVFEWDPGPVLLTSGMKGEAAFDRQENLMLFELSEVMWGRQEDVLSSLFHEHSHRLQYEAISDPRAFPLDSERVIGAWEDNLRPGEYRSSGILASERFAYENQPVERHAVSRAEQLMRIAHEYASKQP